MEHIFISYRREDAADVAGRIYDRLKAHFGEEVIFKDVDKIPFGVDFRHHLDGKVSECRAFLVIIGRRWLDTMNEKGQPRLEDPADFVRVEVESALKRDIPVIPLLVDGTMMPSTEELPETMRDLSYRNAVPVRPDPDFHNDMNRLINGLEHQLGIRSLKASAGEQGGAQARRTAPTEPVGDSPTPPDGAPGHTGRRGRLVAISVACVLLVAAAAYFAVGRLDLHPQNSAQLEPAPQVAGASSGVDDPGQRARTEPAGDVSVDAQPRTGAQAGQRGAVKVTVAAEFRGAQEAERIEQERARLEDEARRAEQARIEEARVEQERARREDEARRAEQARIEAARVEQERARREDEARRAEQARIEEARVEQERARREDEARRAEQARIEEERARVEAEARRREQDTEQARLARTRERAEEAARLQAARAAAESQRLAMVTTEQARLRNEEEARKEAERRMAARSVRLGLYPHETLSECYHSVRDHLPQAASDLAAARPNVDLTFSWYAPGPPPPGLGGGTRVWAGNAVRKSPAVAEIQAVSRGLGVNAVLMGWFECSSSSRVDDYQYQVTVFLVDVLSGKVYREKTGLYSTAETVRKLLDRLAADRG